MTDSRGYVAICLLVDRSGSMQSIRAATEEALAGFLAEQTKETGLTTVHVALFNTAHELTHRMADPASVTVTIDPRGGTSLFDVTAICIDGFAKELDALPDHAKPSQIVFAIASDGEDTSSIVHTANSVKKMIESKEDGAGWSFLYLAANQDAILNGTRMGIKADASLRFDANADGVASMGAAASRFVGDVRRGDRKGFTEVERTAASRRSN